MKTFTLLSSVGNGGNNSENDVLAIQKALNQIAQRIGLTEPLIEDGKLAADLGQSKTCQAIGQFQMKVVGYSKPDYRIDVGGKTARMLSDTLVETDVKDAIASVLNRLFSGVVIPEMGLSKADYQEAADMLECEVAAILAVSDVESSGQGFFSAGVPCLLFEAHHFSKYTSHQYDDSDPEISSRKWNRSLYRGGEKEYIRLDQAMKLDAEAALLSASYGRYQIMGFNYKNSGYSSVADFVLDMFRKETNHLKAFVHHIKANNSLSKAIREKDWETFARYYNGPKYKENKYDQKMHKAYDKYSQL